MGVFTEDVSLNVENVEESQIYAVFEPVEYTAILGESAAIQVPEAINYIKSGQAEINEVVQARTQEFNQNAADKTNSFNQNATDKTNNFNLNTTNKTEDFNQNASNKTGDFNSNASDKTGDFNLNATSKTNDFNDNYIEKKGLIDAEVSEAEAFSDLAKQWAVGEPTEPTGHSSKYWAEQASQNMPKDGQLDIQVNGTSVATFTANQATNTTANIVVPDSATWGNITGDIADQTDLKNALDDKQDILSGGRYIEIVSGGTLATLPEGCKQVEYITATGTQHLDTLITATNDYEIRAKFRLTELNDSFLYGARQSYGSSSFALHKDYAPFSTDVGTGYVNLGVDSWYSVKQNKNGIYVNNLLAHAYNNSLASFTTPNTIRVFAMAQGNNAMYGSTFMKGDFASFEIYNNGVLVCNLVPCIDSNDVACMYDTVNERFLYNSGTGSFTAGAEVVPSDTVNCTLTSGDISTLLGYTPVNPSDIGNATITITQGGVSKGTFTTNQSGNATIDVDAATIPSNMVTTDTDQNITGVKTYINPPIFSIQTYTAYNTGNTDTPYKKIASCVMTGANQTTAIPFIFCVSHASASSGTYNGKILFRTGATAGTISSSNSGVILNGNPDFISNGNIVFYLMYKNNYPNSNKVTFEVWVYVKNTYQGVCIMPLRIGAGATGTQNISLVTWGNDGYASLPDGYSTINQTIL